MFIFIAVNEFVLESYRFFFVSGFCSWFFMHIHNFYGFAFYAGTVAAVAAVRPISYRKLCEKINTHMALRKHTSAVIFSYYSYYGPYTKYT